MIWAVELGNTRTKVSFVKAEDANAVETQFFAPDDFSWLDAIDPNAPIRVANTARRNLPPALLGHQVTLDAPWPFTLACAPTIGVDRCLAALGARQLHPKGPLAVISCGTCLTGTLLDGNNFLKGGPISPGWSMRLKAMAHFAPALPALEPVKRPFYPSGSVSTAEGMHEGAYAGMQAEIDHWIAGWQQEFAGIEIGRAHV